MDPKKLTEMLGEVSIKGASSTGDRTTSTDVQGGASAVAGASAAEPVGGVGDSAFSQIFPVLQGYMNQESALACRVVCKDWKKGVDEALSGVNSNPSPKSPSGSKKT